MSEQRASAPTFVSADGHGQGSRVTEGALKVLPRWMPVLHVWKHPLARYVFGVMVVGIAFVFGLGASPWFGNGLPYITFFPAVVLVAVVCGLGPGLIATGLSTLLAWYWFLPPVGSFSIERTSDAFALMVFSGTATFITAFAAVYHEARRRLAMELAVRAIEEKHRAFFENIHEFAAVYQASRDEHGNVAEWTFRDMNARTRNFLERTFRTMGCLGTDEVLLGKSVSQLLGVEHAAWLAKKWLGVLAGPPVTYERSFGGCEYAVTAFKISEEAIATVEFDITDRKRSEEALREANRRKDEFLAVLSHELRNPLAPIRNSLYILDHADAAGQQARQAKEVIARQVTQVARLVDDLLEVTRIARGRIHIQRTRLDLARLVGRVGEDHRTLMQGRQVEFLIDLPRQSVWVDGDETRLAQVVSNLLQNAAKFTPAGGQVALSVVPVGNEVEVWVRDSGAGIEPGLVEQIFEPFMQAKQTLARTEGGLGLGLALVKGLTELHGGSVQARSPGEGKGAEFVVRLPSVSPPATRPGETGHAALAKRSRRVLVVDDNRDEADSLAQVVQMFGHKAEVALDGKSAIAKVTANPPDVVLCDIGLPGMSGYDVARALHMDLGLNGVQLFAVTGYAQPADRNRAAEAGFAALLAKPPDLSELERLLA